MDTEILRRRRQQARGGNSMTWIKCTCGCRSSRVLMVENGG